MNGIHLAPSGEDFGGITTVHGFGFLLPDWVRRVLPGVVLLGAWSVGLMSGSAAATGEDLSFETLVSEAKKARKDNEPERAAEYLRRAYRIKPVPVLLNNLGKVYEELGWYAEAHEAYKRVTDDPSAPTDLRRLDESRVAKLAPKLGQAWVRCPRDIGWSALWINGEPYPVGSSVELGVTPGFSQFEIQSDDPSSVLLRMVQANAGRRLEVSPTLGTPSVEHGLIKLDGVRGLVMSIGIDGYMLKARPGVLKSIKIPGGERLLQVEIANQRTQSFRVFVPSGGTVNLAEYLKPNSANDNSQVPTVSAAPGSSIMIYVSMGLSVSMLGLGVMEIVNATDGFAQLRSNIDGQASAVTKARMDADVSPEDDLTMMLQDIYSQQQAYRDFNTHSDAMKMGTILTTLGGVGFASSLVWLTLSEMRAGQGHANLWRPDVLPVVWRHDNVTRFGIGGSF